MVFGASSMYPTNIAYLWTLPGASELPMHLSIGGLLSAVCDCYPKNLVELSLSVKKNLVWDEIFTK